MLCKQCGYYAEDDAIVCPECGAMLRSDADGKGGAEAIRQGKRAREAVKNRPTQKQEEIRRRRSGASRATIPLTPVRDTREEEPDPDDPRVVTGSGIGDGNEEHRDRNAVERFSQTVNCEEIMKRVRTALSGFGYRYIGQKEEEIGILLDLDDLIIGIHHIGCVVVIIFAQTNNGDIHAQRRNDLLGDIDLDAAAIDDQQIRSWQLVFQHSEIAPVKHFPH